MLLLVHMLHPSLISTTMGLPWVLRLFHNPKEQLVCHRVEQITLRPTPLRLCSQEQCLELQGIQEVIHPMARLECQDSLPRCQEQWVCPMEYHSNLECLSLACLVPLINYENITLVLVDDAPLSPSSI
ncbi:unnamed protein product [Dicrocoelium dendriticum]|nr:unnamed protein product [Dicrocoelium dendriticum]